MVVLEPVPSSEETSRDGDNVKPKSSTTKASVTAAVDSAGYASDGFETASETEVSDDEDDTRGGANCSTDKRDAVDHEAQQEQQEDRQSIPAAVAKDHVYEDALNDEELSQKILAQVNEVKVEGNKLFADSQYEEALSKYDSALQLAPEMSSFVEVRAICHANRATCFSKLGKYEDTIKESTKALELNPTYMKALLRRGEAHEKLEHYDEAIADMTKIVELDPSNQQARRTALRLEPLAREKREKMKEEMIGKLKDMGNSILGRFGMSIDNFKAVQDPNTGSYSISFQQ